MYLIDTVVLSELRKPQRDAGLSSWVERQRTSDLFVSVINTQRRGKSFCVGAARQDQQKD
jgi:predicted nucleic acid-binding protein